jgi:hypothetical protein
MWLCLVSVRCIMVGFSLEFRMWCRSMIVLCIPLVLNVTACMGGCLYDVVEVSSVGDVGVLLCCILVECWVVEILRVKNLSSVCWFCLVCSIGGLYGSVHGAGNAMLMRGGACAAELRLLGLWVASYFEVGVGCACCSF